MVDWCELKYLFDLVELPIDSEKFRSAVESYGLICDLVSGSEYWESVGAGIAVEVEAGRIDTIFLFGNGKDDFASYKGPLPLGLSFSANRDEVRNAFGTPTETGKPMRINETIRHSGWDIFQDKAGRNLHVTYSADTGLVDLITLSRGR